jgi:hygromycin-B 7''-O-kinase
MAKDLYLQPDAPDTVLEPEVVLSLVRRYVPSAMAITGVDESGGEARTYAVDDQIILKTQRPNRLRPRTSLEKEVFFLNQLAAHPGISVPGVLGYGREGTIEYTCMTRIDGVAVVNTTLAGEARKAALRQLGTTLRRIHQVDQAPFRKSNLFIGDRSFAGVRARFEDLFATVTERIRTEAIPWSLPVSPEEVASRALVALPETDERVALHSNPGPTHTFVQAQTGAFSGLIDFGDAYISHPAFDLRQWRLPQDRAELLAGYTVERPVSADFMTTWNVVMVLAELIAIAYQRGHGAEADLTGLLASL